MRATARVAVAAVMVLVLAGAVHGPPAPVRAATLPVRVDFAPAMPAAARTAFEHAVRRWAAMIALPATLDIKVGWAPLGPGRLGHMGPKAVLVRKRWHPTPLAEAVLGRDVELPGGAADIEGTFNSGISNWYFGTDGRPPPGQADFVSVVMHELGHGLGMVGWMTKDSVTGAGRWSTPGGIYDTFAATATGRRLMSFPNGSRALGTQLTGGRLYWAGRRGVRYNGGVRPRLYAPRRWVQGTSYMHLNEATYRARRNALMTPLARNGEATHSPGPIVLGMLRDMGWRLGPEGRRVVGRLTLAGLRASHRVADRGTAVTLRATLRTAEGATPIAGKRLKLYQRRPGASRWRLVASRLTSSRGAAAFTVRRSATLQYQIRHPRSSTTDADASPLRTVRVR